MLTDSRKIIARLKRDGWVKDRQAGSHAQFVHPDRAGRVTVPHPKRDVPRGTAMSIYRQAGWPKD